MPRLLWVAVLVLEEVRKAIPQAAATPIHGRQAKWNRQTAQNLARNIRCVCFAEKRQKSKFQRPDMITSRGSHGNQPKRMRENAPIPAKTAATLISSRLRRLQNQQHRIILAVHRLRKLQLGRILLAVHRFLKLQQDRTTRRHHPVKPTLTQRPLLAITSTQKTKPVAMK